MEAILLSLSVCPQGCAIGGTISRQVWRGRAIVRARVRTRSVAQPAKQRDQTLARATESPSVKGSI